MNREEAKEFLEKRANDWMAAMRAFADGEEVEFLSSKWYSADEPSFDLSLQWRVKPKRYWFNVYKASGGAMYGGHMYSTERDAEKARGFGIGPFSIELE